MAYGKKEYDEDLDTYVKEKVIKDKPLSEEAENARQRLNQHPDGMDRGYKEHR